MIEYIITFIIIYAACILAELTVIYFERRKEKKLDIGCDYCEKAVPLAPTPNKVFYLCKQCMEAYFREHEGEFTEEQIAKVKRSYRRRKRKK
jgi:hypothetical protein